MVKRLFVLFIEILTEGKILILEFCSSLFIKRMSLIVGCHCLRIGLSGFAVSCFIYYYYDYDYYLKSSTDSRISYQHRQSKYSFQ